MAWGVCGRRGPAGPWSLGVDPGPPGPRSGPSHHGTEPRVCTNGRSRETSAPPRSWWGQWASQAGLLRVGGHGDPGGLSRGGWAAPGPRGPQPELWPLPSPWRPGLPLGFFCPAPWPRPAWAEAEAAGWLPGAPTAVPTTLPPTVAAAPGVPNARSWPAWPALPQARLPARLAGPWTGLSPR